MSSPISLNLKPVRNLYKLIASVISPSSFTVVKLDGTSATLANKTSNFGYNQNVKTIGIEYVKFRLGNSETPVYSPDKYDVQSPIDESGIVFNTPVVNTSVNEDTGEIEVEVRQVIQNNKDSDITISEVGLVMKIVYKLNVNEGANQITVTTGNILVAYGIPDQQITIPAGQSYEFIAKVRVSPITPEQ